MGTQPEAVCFDYGKFEGRQCLNIDIIEKQCLDSLHYCANDLKAKRKPCSRRTSILNAGTLLSARRARVNPFWQFTYRRAFTDNDSCNIHARLSGLNDLSGRGERDNRKMRDPESEFKRFGYDKDQQTNPP